jgi:hypothetical protein
MNVKRSAPRAQLSSEQPFGEPEGTPILHGVNRAGDFEDANSLDIRLSKERAGSANHAVKRVGVCAT